MACAVGDNHPIGFQSASFHAADFWQSGFAMGSQHGIAEDFLYDSRRRVVWVVVEVQVASFLVVVRICNSRFICVCLFNDVCK